MRSGPAITALIVGVMFAVLGFIQIDNRVRRDETISFRHFADRQIAAIEQQLGRNLETVHSLGGLFDASEVVSRKEFTKFAIQMVSRVEGVQALSWNPRVPAERLSDIKRLARREGMSQYEFYERGKGGERLALRVRDEHVPVLYIEPLAGNEAALGFDIASNSERRVALDTARDTGHMVATAPIRLVQEAGEQSGVLVLRPVYINGIVPETQERRRRSIQGYAVGVYRIGDIMAAATKTSGSSPLHIALFDATDAEKPPIPMYLSDPHPSEGTGFSSRHGRNLNDLEITKKVTFANRDWILKLHPSAALVTSVERFSSWGFLVAGLTLTLVAYLFLVSNRSRRLIIETEVTHRTRELAQEIAERKAAETALRRSEQTYAQLSALAPIGILVFSEGKVQSANAEAARLLGAASVDDILGRDRMEFVHPDQRDKAEERDKALKSGEFEKLFEIELRRLDGTTFPAVVRAETVDIEDDQFIISVLEDATDEIATRNAVSESEEKYRSLIEFFPEGVLLSESGIITQINSAGVRLYGAEREADIIGRDWMTLVDPMYHEQVMARRKLMQQGEQVEPIEIRMLRVDGSSFWGVSQAMPVEVAGKSIYMTVFDDISDRKAAAREIEDTNRELVRSNEELAQFAYVASHDLKEPLRMVSSYCGLISDRYADKLDETGQKFVYFAQDGAIRMQKLIDDLLVYSKIGRGGENVEPVDLRGVVDEVTHLLSEAIRENGATLNVGELPTVMGYPAELTRLFQNMIGNAVKFKGEAALVIDIEAERTESSWRIKVSDNGIGIAPEYRDRVFGIFQRLHGREEYEGTGIGLAICAKIVAQMRGEMSLEESVNGGCAFSFTIPDGRIS